MSESMTLAEKIQREIQDLPQESLPDLEQFVEFLRFKSQAKTQQRTLRKSPLKIVKLRGIMKSYDFSPEMLAEARREMWYKFHAEER